METCFNPEDRDGTETSASQKPVPLPHSDSPECLRDTASVPCGGSGATVSPADSLGLGAQLSLHPFTCPADFEKLTKLSEPPFPRV